MKSIIIYSISALSAIGGGFITYMGHLKNPAPSWISLLFGFIFFSLLVHTTISLVILTVAGLIEADTMIHTVMTKDVSVYHRKFVYYGSILVIALSSGGAIKIMIDILKELNSK